MSTPEHDPAAAPAGAATGTGAVRQLLRLAIGSQHYAIPIDVVREILKLGRLTQLPRTPAFVRGVMNLRGAVVPVIDLGERLGLGATTATRRACVVIVELQRHDPPHRQTVGVVVDAVHEVVDIAAADLEPPPPLGTRVSADLLEGMARLRSAFVPLLALERVLDEDALAHDIAQNVQATARAPLAERVLP